MDSFSYTRYAAALLFVLALIAGLTWVAKRFGLVARATITNKSKTKRLDVVEVLNVDARRKLVLIRRDGCEHLLLLGPERDLVVETGIAPKAAPPARKITPNKSPKPKELRS